MSRRGSAKPTGIQMFPFLAVLICTMGALVVLLHAFAKSGQAQAEKVAIAKEREQQEQQELDADFFRWRSTHLREARDKTQADLEAERLRLSHIEDHQRRLEAKLVELKIAAEELVKAGEAKAGERKESEVELAKIKDELEKARSAVEKARRKGKHEAVNYSVVPFEGRNSTHRRPVYIECQANKIILQPEGVELAPSDFIGYFGPGNPLAAALRAQREYFAKQSPDGVLDEEPYPLLLVRPEGIAAYYAARAALESWGSDFGYELIGGDWDLTFPPEDARLGELTQRVVEEARERMVEYIANSPQYRRSRSRPVYHVKSHGGIAQEPGTGDGPRGNPLGIWDDPGSWANDAGSAPRGTGGAYSDGGFGDDPTGFAGTSPLAEYAPEGAGGGNPYAEPSAIEPQVAGQNRQGGTILGSQFAQMQHGGNDRYAAGGSGPGGVNSQTGPYGSSPNGAQPKLNAPSGGQAPGPPGSPGAERSGNPGSGKPGSGKPGGGKPHSGAPLGQPAPPDGQQPAGIPPSAVAMAAKAQSGAAPTGGAPPDATFARDAANLDHSQYAAGASESSGSPESYPLDQEPSPYALGKRSKPKSMATTRGRDWGLNTSVGAIGASRPVLVQCYGDKLVIVPESRNQPPREIPFGENPETTMDDLVSGIWSHTETWGKAGRGLYWKPTLVVEVRPGGEARFEEMQTLLAGSGLDMERRAAPRAQQSAPPARR